MNEDAQTYKNRLYSYLDQQNPLDIMSQTPQRLEAALRNHDSAQLQKKKETGRWSIADILRHFAEGEIVIAYRLRMIARQPGLSIQAYDQNQWVGNAGYLEPQQALDLFRSIRNANLAFLKNLPKEAWSYYGIHAERGKESIEDVVRLCAGHDLNHLRQVEGQ